MSFNIIGDIAGNFKTLEALLAKMPAGKVISLGDMVDRGPRSKEVLEYVKTNGEAVLANHEHMMLDEYLGGRTMVYGGGVWLNNGGWSTMLSFFPDLNKEDMRDAGRLLDHWMAYSGRTGDADDRVPDIRVELYKEHVKQLPADIMDWIKELPQFKELDGNGEYQGYQYNGLFLSHAPKRPDWSMELCQKLEWPKLNEGLLWNRGSPRRMKNPDGSTRLQVYGHNSYKDVEEFKDKEGVYALCIDTSWGKKLTGLHWPSMELFEQEYID